ncbi:NUDIX domain-containing protein [Candidatus Kuenenbacteria bacterium]|nr:NUDIX domain-containing protein [Candidatus Kuenenbacteria bacterium]
MSQNNDLKKHFTASALIIEDNKALLLYHKKLDVWLYPGGHVEDNETPEQTVIREVKEETGLDIEIIGEKDHDLADPEADVSVLCTPHSFLCELVGDHYHNDIIYLCKISGENKDIKHNPDESSDIKYFGLDDLDNIKLFPNFKRLLTKVLENEDTKSE